MTDSGVAPGFSVSHWIGGRTVSVNDNGTLPLHNPSTGRAIGTVRAGGLSEVEAAVEAASIAYPAWSATPATKRARVMFRFAHLLQQHAQGLAKMIARENGKTIADAMGEVARGTDVVEFACGAPTLLQGQFSEGISAGLDSYGVREPLGVVAGITPFNFPVMVPLWMAPVAVVCGNTFVLKPSEKDPSPAIRIAELLREAGLPDGVFNVVHGEREAVEALVTHPKVRAVSFVGSTPVAKRVYELGTQHEKRVQALGGAKNHMIVLPDANLSRTAKALMGAAFGSAGQRCMAISVVVAVGDELADRLRTQLVEMIDALRVGRSDDADSDMGPLVTQAHLEKVKAYVAAGEAEGAELVRDGRKGALPPDGYFLNGTLFDRVRPSMRIYREEIFGPVLSLVRVKSIEEALELVNGHAFANGVCVFSDHLRLANQFARRVECGMVGINVPLPVPTAAHSFGGWRSSLFGDHHVHGAEGVRFYTRLKCVTQRWKDPEDEAQFSMPNLR